MSNEATMSAQLSWKAAAEHFGMDLPVEDPLGAFFCQLGDINSRLTADGRPGWNDKGISLTTAVVEMYLAIRDIIAKSLTDHGLVYESEDLLRVRKWFDDEKGVLLAPHSDNAPQWSSYKGLRWSDFRVAWAPVLQTLGSDDLINLNVFFRRALRIWDVDNELLLSKVYNLRAFKFRNQGGHQVTPTHESYLDQVKKRYVELASALKQADGPAVSFVLVLFESEELIYIPPTSPDQDNMCWPCWVALKHCVWSENNTETSKIPLSSLYRELAGFFVDLFWLHRGQSYGQSINRLLDIGASEHGPPTIDHARQTLQQLNNALKLHLEDVAAQVSSGGGGGGSGGASGMEDSSCGHVRDGHCLAGAVIAELLEYAPLFPVKSKTGSECKRRFMTTSEDFEIRKVECDGDSGQVVLDINADMILGLSHLFEITGLKSRMSF